MADIKKSVQYENNQKKMVLQNDYELTSNSPDDPRSRKSWGFITALPSEYLIHFKQGQINKKNSGQGATCFKYPQDTVFIIPTSLKEIVFQANQLTLDNVDVRIRGMAVYRIHDPLRIYKLINFSNRNRAEEKLARMIADMCRSNSKWLVANMKVEECIRKRKEEIAEALKKEVAHVVADPQTGWGLEIITIDIQDVYIQDEEIFSAMQMMFKSGKMRESKLAQLDTERELELKKLASERSLADDRKNNQLDKARIEAEIKDAQILLAKQNEEKQFSLDRYRITQNQELSALKFQQEILQEQGRMQLALEKAEKEAEARRIIHQEELAALKQRIEAENSASPVSLEREFIEKVMPTLAQTLAQSMQNVTFHIMQQDGKGSSPFNFMLMQLMELMKNRFAPLQQQKEEKTGQQ